MTRGRFRHSLSHFAAVGMTAGVLPMFGCGGGDEITGTGQTELVLVEAAAKVNGESINGQTVRSGENSGIVQFEARLMDRHGNPALGHRVTVEYDIPAMGMMHRTGTFMLHDDGTHGDMVPHDGLYCYEDKSNEYGCHGAHAMPGEYHFEFCGIGRDGHETNRMDVRATRVQ